jgi:hypothetical protein
MDEKSRCKMPKKESVMVKGNELVKVIADLARQNDVGKVCLIYEKRRLFEIPFITGDPTAPANVVKGPLLAAINAVATLVNECTVEVEREEKKEKKKTAKIA